MLIISEFCLLFFFFVRTKVKFWQTFMISSSNRQPPVSLEPKIDIKQLKDPEELFLAYERLESKLFLCSFFRTNFRCI